MNIGYQWRPGWSGPASRALRGYRLGETTAPTWRYEAVLGPSASATVSVSIPAARLDALALWADRRVTVARGTAGTSEVQVVSITGGTPTSGNFTLVYSGAASGNIAWDASAAAVKTAVEASSAIGAGKVLTATGGPLPGAAVTLTFDPSLGNVAAPTMGASTLDAGTGAVSTTTNGAAGSTADTMTLNCGVPLVWHADDPRPCPFTADVTALTITNLDASRNARVRVEFDLED